MSNDTNTKLLRLESVVDRVLAKLIEYPAPVTTCCVASVIGCMFIAGWVVRGWFC